MAMAETYYASAPEDCIPHQDEWEADMDYAREAAEAYTKRNGDDCVVYEIIVTPLLRATTKVVIEKM